jgi:hypothetical protein
MKFVAAALAADSLSCPWRRWPSRCAVHFLPLHRTDGKKYYGSSVPPHASASRWNN